MMLARQHNDGSKIINMSCSKTENSCLAPRLFVVHLLSIQLDEWSSREKSDVGMRRRADWQFAMEHIISIQNESS